jgi:hypothetical protein
MFQREKKKRSNNVNYIAIEMNINKKNNNNNNDDDYNNQAAAKT